MRYTLSELETLPIAGQFGIGDSVTIKIYNAETQIELPTDDAVCLDTNGNGFFYWNFSNLTAQPTAFMRLHWIMTNVALDIQSGFIDVGGWVELIAAQKTFLMIPFSIDISKQGVNKGDSWEPEFRIDTNVSGLKVSAELTDLATVDYDQTIVSKATSNITGGGDDQLLLVAEADTFKIYRIYVTGDETASFGSRFFDLTITVKTADDQTLTTIIRKIQFTETPAIKFDTA